MRNGIKGLKAAFNMLRPTVLWQEVKDELMPWVECLTSFKTDMKIEFAQGW